MKSWMTPYYQDTRVTLYAGDALLVLQDLPSANMQTCITSPPYWRLRDYGISGQIGLENTPEDYVQQIVAIFREVRRVLKEDGTVWLVLGDCYNADRRKGHGNKTGRLQANNRASANGADWPRPGVPDLKPKDLVGIPWRTAFALQADGWYLRADIIWSKPNPMPESVKDRPTKAHEYLFLLTKSKDYYYDAKAILEPFADRRQGRDYSAQDSRARERNRGGRTDGFTKPNAIDPSGNGGRNKRSVWTVAPRPCPYPHLAAFPPKLIEPCILAGSKPGDAVMDPFIGSGTTAIVASGLGRTCIGIDLRPEYLHFAKHRMEVT